MNNEVRYPLVELDLLITCRIQLVHDLCCSPIMNKVVWCGVSIQKSLTGWSPIECYCEVFHGTGYVPTQSSTSLRS